MLHETDSSQNSAICRNHISPLESIEFAESGSKFFKTETEGVFVNEG